MRRGLKARIGTAGLYSVAVLRVAVIGAIVFRLYPPRVEKAAAYHEQVLRWSQPEIFIQAGVALVFYLLLVWLAHARYLILDAIAVVLGVLVLYDGVIDYARGLAEIVEKGLQG